MFEQDYKLLNDEQRQVVNNIYQNTLVLAPAGTGKTKVIAMRSAYLVRQDVPPEKMLCLTFTNKAAKEMRERIDVYIPQGSKSITIKTFHAFCYALINAEKTTSHFSFPCTIIDETDSDYIIRNIVEKQGLNDDYITFADIRVFIENIKKHSLGFTRERRCKYEEVISDYLRHQSEYSRQKKYFLARHGSRIFCSYQHYLSENNCVDFMDLIVETKYLLEDDHIRERWNKKYQYIQVDEMQDTSIREYDIISMLAKHNYLAMFGDFNQTIYEWRGSDPKSMVDDFRRDFSPNEITLKINYRTTQTLLEAANDYISSSQLYPVTCLSYSETRGEKINIIEGHSKEDEINLIVKSIKAHSEAAKSVAVLTRTNDYARYISEVFQREHIPCSIIEDTKIFRRKEIKDLLAFFEYSINPRSSHALFKICRHPYLNMESWLLSSLNCTKDVYMYLHDWINIDSKDPYLPLFEGYQGNKVVVLDVESTGLDTTKEDIIQIAAIRFGKRGVIESLDVLVKPTKAVGNSYYVHGFTDEELNKNGMRPKEALEKLITFIQDAVIVGHNINYDIQIIKSMLKRYEMPDLLTMPIYDTLDLAYKVYPNLMNHKLSTLSEFLKTNTAPNHNAMQDILATGEVLVHLIEKISLKSQERFEKLEALYSYLAEYKAKIYQIKNYILSHSVSESIIYMMNDCGFKKYYSEKEMQILRELYRISNALYDKSLGAEDNILQLLSFASLHYSEIEQSELFKERIPIITVHQAKGLEFDHVYIAGCNDKVFPLSRSVRANQLPEEKRLFYVGITRARRALFLSYHQERPKSIFIDEIGEQYKVYKKDSQTL